MLAVAALALVGAAGDAFAQATSTVVASQENPSVVGQTVTFIATVTVTGPFVPGGQVQFFDGATLLGSSFVGAGSAIFNTLSPLTLGTHTITAVYGGDTNGNLGSTSPPLTQVVSQAPTTTVVTSSLNPSTAGQTVTFTATVTNSGLGTPAPTGTVQFKDGATNLGVVTLVGGSASFTTSALTQGPHSISAVYGGDTSNLTSTGTLNQAVNPAATPTTTTLISSLNPSNVGQLVTFTATVTGNAPTGTLQFKDGATNLGVVTLVGGSASFTTSALTQGPHTISAVYGGDTSNLTSTGTLNQTVNSLTVTTTTVTSSLNPSVISQAVTFTATVTGSSPTGTVQFKDGATNLGAPVTLTAGAASFTTSALTQGPHTISAVYSGDTNNATSNGQLTQTVNGVALSITSPNATTFRVGSAGTFTITASGNPSPTLSETGALPTGVNFTNNGNGTATLTGAPVPGTGGTYPITITAANGVAPPAT
jgi:Bacterial Ig-like domain (group 3)